MVWLVRGGAWAQASWGYMCPACLSRVCEGPCSRLWSSHCSVSGAQGYTQLLGVDSLSVYLPCDLPITNCFGLTMASSSGTSTPQSTFSEGLFLAQKLKATYLFLNV